MWHIRKVKRAGPNLLISTGAEGDEPGDILAIPVAGIAARAALLGCTVEDAFAAHVEGRLDAVEWAPLYRSLAVAEDTPAQIEARAAAGVQVSNGLNGSTAVQLQDGRVDEIGAVMWDAPPISSEMTFEDIAMAVQVGDIRGKLQRALTACATDVAEIEAEVARSRGLAS